MCIGVGSQQAGAQGLLINAPYYNRPSAEGVYRHIMAVVEATDLPVMIYDILGRTGVRITDATLARLAAHERVLAVKDATGDVEQAFRRMEATGLAYYSGDDGLNFAFLAHGASGVVSVVAHADAHFWREMITEVDAGDLPGARAVAQRMRPLVAAMMIYFMSFIIYSHFIFSNRIPFRFKSFYISTFYFLKMIINVIFIF